jgi:hypothetical protein
MANSDDPPYLTVGTEVSAKYRGAFCEATIKVAKKMVKCKVSSLTHAFSLPSSRSLFSPSLYFLSKSHLLT